MARASAPAARSLHLLIASNSSMASTKSSCPACRCQRRRNFSSTPSRDTRQRHEMFTWLRTHGKNFEAPVEGQTNYLTDYTKDGTRAAGSESRDDRQSGENQAQNGLHQPFPLNRSFYSQSVLSTELREEIWKRVTVDGKSVRAVSVELNVEMRRVGAVVRLMAIEKRWQAEKKPLALPYSEAVLNMVPTTPLTSPPQLHEPINDLPVHNMTQTQLFHPTSESRPFNRVDAGRVFSGAPRLPDTDPSEPSSNNAWEDSAQELIGKPSHSRPVLKAADSRIPHPHLIPYEQDKGTPGLDSAEREARYQARLRSEVEQRAEAKEKQRQRVESRITRIDKGRFEFLVKEVSTSRIGTGLDGRGTGSPGIRYGVPSQDRKKGHVKIPTRVEV